MNKEELLKALDEIKESYDAFYFENKYGSNTHQKQFDLLEQNVKGDKIPNALGWIKNCYDYYYKDDYKDEGGTAFEYIRNRIEKDSELELNFDLDELQTQELVETGFVVIDDYCITMINNDIMVYKAFEDYNGVKLFRGNNKNE